MTEIVSLLKSILWMSLIGKCDADQHSKQKEDLEELTAVRKPQLISADKIEKLYISNCSHLEPMKWVEVDKVWDGYSSDSWLAAPIKRW